MPRDAHGEDDYRQDNDCSSRHDHASGQVVTAHKAGGGNRCGAGFRSRQDQGEKHLVPGKNKTEDRADDNPRRGEGQDNPRENLEHVHTIDDGGLVNFFENVAKLIHGQPDDQRNVEGQIVQYPTV